MYTNHTLTRDVLAEVAFTAVNKMLMCSLLVQSALTHSLRANDWTDAAKRARELEPRTRDTVLNERIDAHWFEDRPQFWYRRQNATNRFTFVRVNASTATKRPAFDHARLANAWQRALGKTLDPENLPISTLRFTDSDRKLLFEGGGDVWACALDTYSVQRSTQRVASAIERLPGPSRKTGAATSLLVINRTGGEIQLWWHDSTGKRHAYGRLADGQECRQNTFEGHVWQATSRDGSNLGAVMAGKGSSTAVFDGTLPPAPRLPPDQSVSPDGRWQALIKNHNLWLKQTGSGELLPLSMDGAQDDDYGLPVYWAPDSSRVVALKTLAGDHRVVTLVESSPADQIQPKVHKVNYLKAGDRIPHTRPRLFDIDGRHPITISEDLFQNPWSIDNLRWEADSQSFTFIYNERGHQVLRVISVDRNGQPQSRLEERSATFIDYAGKFYCHFRKSKRELLWMSERDGWNHLYRHDMTTGRLINAVTQGPWVVRGVEDVDDANERIWFTLSGLYPKEDPYYIHHARINFDGTGLILLTAGNGTHEVAWSPDRRFLIDTWSRVDQPPVSVLRDGETGRELLVLERADITALVATGWKMPEPFTAKGRDGKTDICGVIWRPTTFSSGQRYPVIENIYAGPHSSFVPKAFAEFHRQQRLAELGFIVVMIDGMGTSHRSKAFHDICWKNLGDAGFPDRIAWMRAAASTRPWLDLTRVGIYGGSAGGQSALRGMLMYPDFYKVGVADCGCHDNRMDKIWWNELWMGWPVGPHYAEQSNVTQARRLQGKLMLIVGELDNNVDPSSTLQVAHALIKADKDFELVLIPGTGHGAAETPYGSRRRADFFLRHLLGK